MIAVAETIKHNCFYLIHSLWQMEVSKLVIFPFSCHFIFLHSLYFSFKTLTSHLAHYFNVFVTHCSCQSKFVQKCLWLILVAWRQQLITKLPQIFLEFLSQFWNKWFCHQITMKYYTTTRKSFQLQQVALSDTVIHGDLITATFLRSVWDPGSLSQLWRLVDWSHPPEWAGTGPSLTHGDNVSTGLLILWHSRLSLS